MRKNRRISGFTMAELLIVVAIIAVLGGVSFIAVQRYNRGMAQLERDSIAKEIFVAAQNHLTMADSQGYPGVTSYGTAGTMTGVDTKPNIYYFDADGFTEDGTSALDLMLPFGAVDETVRGGGAYIIRYQSNPAAVLDVFYCTRSGNYSYDLSADDYEDVMALRGDGKKASRRDSSAFNNAVIGWYGGGEGLETGGTLQPPVIEVENADRLIAKVRNPNLAIIDSETGKQIATLKLIVTGITSKAQKAITLSAVGGERHTAPERVDAENEDFTVVLDDITQSGFHFADLLADTTDTFIPGEDITVRAVAYSNTTLTNIAYSAEITANSLFADMFEPEPEAGEDPDPDFTPVEGEVEADKKGNTAVLTSIRHLENLNRAVSGFDPDHLPEDLKVDTASQAVDLDWNGFKEEIAKASVDVDADKVSVYDTVGNKTEDGCFRPVDLDYILTYDGNGKAIQNIKVNYAGNAGVFGTVGAADKVGSAISNLEIVDCDIASTGTGDNGNAGALAGSLTGVTITNVLAHGKSEFDDVDDADNPIKATRNIVATGSAGGLVGAMRGGGVNASAAALYVKGGAEAGGLIGRIAANGTDSGSVDHSYSGGHTKDAAYETDRMNVTATGSAGGLIGDAGGATIENSYSTCSATGKVVGGLVGAASGGIDNCYATGLVRCVTDEDGNKVEGALEGAFAGELKGADSQYTDCLYYEIINEGMPFVGKAPEGAAYTDITALDESATTYNDFVGAPTNWQPAAAYDKDKLTELFGEDRYSLQTVGQLDAELVTDGLFVAAHYGDWPAPETLVVNTKSTT